jgi:uncharacterized protein YndB with AHSA1/START domain
MLKKILLALLAVIAVFVVVVATRPAKFHIERSAEIAAPPAVVFALIDDFHAWQSWSPWEKLDPNMKREHSGAPKGKGAAYAWSGNEDVGSGSMTISESTPPERVQIQLEFKEPWQASNVTLFSVEPAANGSNVTWSMEGENNFGAKAASMFMDMDAMVGKDFSTGLANLGAIAEATAAKQAEEARLAEEVKQAAEAKAQAEAAAAAGTAEPAPTTAPASARE